MEDIDQPADADSEPLQLPDYDKAKLHEEKREELANFPEEELLAELERQADEEQEWRDEYDVDSPDELEAAINEEMSVEERKRRRAVVYYWCYNRYVREVIEEVLDDG